MVALHPTVVFDAFEWIIIAATCWCDESSQSMVSTLPSRFELIDEAECLSINSQKLEIQYPSCYSVYKCNCSGGSWLRMQLSILKMQLSIIGMQMISQLCISCSMFSVSCLFPQEIPECSLPLHGSQLLCAQSCRGLGYATKTTDLKKPSLFSFINTELYTKC